MKEIETIHAAGHVLCHDITEIVKGQKKGPAFRKGHIVTEEDIPVLLRLGRIICLSGRKRKGFSMKMKLPGFCMKSAGEKGCTAPMCRREKSS